MPIANTCIMITQYIAAPIDPQSKLLSRWKFPRAKETEIAAAQWTHARGSASLHSPRLADIGSRSTTSTDCVTRTVAAAASTDVTSPTSDRVNNDAAAV